MSYNFSFLNKHDYYKSFADAFIEAEKGIAISNTISAFICRRAMELAIKWLYSFDEKLIIPRDKSLFSLMSTDEFMETIDSEMLSGLHYIRKIGNKSGHENRKLKREQVVKSLSILFEFAKWIDYKYSDEIYEGEFDEELLNTVVTDVSVVEESKKLYKDLADRDIEIEKTRAENAELVRVLTAKRVANENSRVYSYQGLSEDETRQMYIDVDIQSMGWILGNDCVREMTLVNPNDSSDSGCVDYVLLGDDKKPLAVIEAKKTSVDPRVGKAQALDYVRLANEIYGYEPVAFYTNGFDYYIIDGFGTPSRKVSGIFSKKDLEKIEFQKKNRLALEDLDISEEITNREYQKDAINAVCHTLSRNRRKALLVMATGSGKTRIAISLVDVLMRKKWVKNVLLLADRKNLVKQAKNSFNQHLNGNGQKVSLCNLLLNKEDPNSRIVFSTYQTMMGAIDSTTDETDSVLFTPGHFDLIIVDESHRSIYKKYKAIFDYFDGFLVGLTATPKSDFDRNTYEIFDLNDNKPTFEYDLDTAVSDGYLVDFHSIESKLKFQDKGIHYDELSEEDKIKFDEVFDEDIRDISGHELNEFLFNTKTVDIVLDELMEKGIRVDGNEKIGKTIIFAKNIRHALYIVERFELHYPEFGADFIGVVHNKDSRSEKTQENFSEKDKNPQIVVSVDMLDTGVDIPEVVNLVFFKKVRSYSKFWQMIGRGTRLCEDLFGIGIDKSEFRIFDYCSNFKFFRETTKFREINLQESLSAKIFKVKLDIIKGLLDKEFKTEEEISFLNQLITKSVEHICMIDESRFDVKPSLKYIHAYNKTENWMYLNKNEVRNIKAFIVPLLPSLRDEDLSKRVDKLMYFIMSAKVNNFEATNEKATVLNYAVELSKHTHKTNVRTYEYLLREVQTKEYWQSADLNDFNDLRLVLRELVFELDRESKKPLYTDLTDELLETKVYNRDFEVSNYFSYKKKIEDYFADAENKIVNKLRQLLLLTDDDKHEIERLFISELGSKKDYEREYSEQSYIKTAASLVGLSSSAVREFFKPFIENNSFNDEQQEFINHVIDYIMANGWFDYSVIDSVPFDNYGDIAQVFSDKTKEGTELFVYIKKLNERVE